MKKKPVTVSDLGSQPKPKAKKKAKEPKEQKVDATGAYTFVSEGFHGAPKAAKKEDKEKAEKHSFLGALVARVKEQAWDHALVRQAYELYRVGRAELERRLKPFTQILER